MPRKYRDPSIFRQAAVRNFGRLIMVVLGASLVSHRAAAGSAQLHPDQASILAEVRAHSLAYTAKLPDFVCTQTTRRETTGRNRIGATIGEDRVLSTDVVEEKLTYFQHQETYEVVAINLKKVTGLQHTQVAGATSTGEFGSLLHDIFNPDSHAVFSWDRMDKLQGRRSYVFAFAVPKEFGIHVSDKISKQEISASYRGLIFVDLDSKQVLRITTHVDLPPKFAMKRAERVVDYRPVTIAGNIYDLPFASELRMEDPSYTYVNKIAFKDYHKFTVESTVTYGYEPPSHHAPEVAINPTIGASAGQVPVQVLTPATETQETPATRNAEQQQVSQAIERTTVASPPRIVPDPPTKAVEDAASHTGAPPTALASPLKNASGSDQPTSGPPGPPPGSATPTLDTNYRLQVKVNVVLVPVVARDAQDHAVGNLIKDDFEIFDRGKQQEITSFMVESHTAQGGPNAPQPARPIQTTEQGPANNFIVYLFDDLHLEFNDLAVVRQAARRNMETMLPTDRAAIFTTSGRLTLDFTIDRTQLHQALLKLQPHGGSYVQECPDISSYMANQILNVYDPTQISTNPPLQAATAETMSCMSLPHQAEKMAEEQAVAKASSVLRVAGQESRNTLLAMKEIIRIITWAPGNKTVVFISPGFGLESGMSLDATAVIDEAIRANVAISALDARGLYTLDESGKIQNGSANSTVTRIKADLDRDAAKENSGVMKELAAATGGVFIHNTNDLQDGFRRLTTPPDSSYLLGFVPEKVKLDGGFHALKVQLNGYKNLTLQARSGYYAPKK